MGVRAGIVVTGTEVLTGRVRDLNGPWLAEELRRLGVDVGQVVVVGDRPDDLRTALEFLAAGNDLVITSGGLGPTADDLTAAVVAQVQGRAPRLDQALEQRIAAIVARLSARFGGVRHPEASAIATRKQAMVPDGADVLEPTGTAPGLVVPVAVGRVGPPVVVLPGPPWELQRMWPAALANAVVRKVIADVPELRQHTLRLWGVPESDLAATLRRLDSELAGLEITTCLRDGELEVVTRYPAEAEPGLWHLVDAVGADFPEQLFSADGAEVDELVARALSDRGWSVAVVEAATGGAVSARLTARSGQVVGGLVVTSITSITSVGSVGSVGAAGAVAMAERARAEFGADVGVGVTAVAEESVHLAVVTPTGERSRTVVAGGAVDMVRGRIGPAVLHLLREALTRSVRPG
jgi:molybdenum cofactor synthesis domain-containing protein